jgi:hypothetical protein
MPGGEGAPDLQETLQNFGINAAALAVLGFFVSRDVAAQRRDQAVIEREEALARLQVRRGAGAFSAVQLETLWAGLCCCRGLAVGMPSLGYRGCAAVRTGSSWGMLYGKATLRRSPPRRLPQVSLGGGDRVIPLAAFRGTTRPVIVAGTRTQLSRALAGAEPFREALRERGVSVVPIQLAGQDPGEKLRALKAEFGAEGGGSGSGKGFGSTAKAAADATPAPATGLSSKARCSPAARTCAGLVSLLLTPTPRPHACATGCRGCLVRLVCFCWHSP